METDNARARFCRHTCLETRALRFGGGEGTSIPWTAILAFSAVTVPIGKLPSPGSEPERVFTSSQPAIADEILGIERRCFTASLLGTRTRSGRERRAQAGIDVVIAEGLL